MADNGFFDVEVNPPKLNESIDVIRADGQMFLDCEFNSDGEHLYCFQKQIPSKENGMASGKCVDYDSIFNGRTEHEIVSWRPRA